MRLTRQQVDTIRQAAETAFGVGTVVTLFGSRVDDSKRGGDIDLLVRPTDQDHPLRRKLRFLALLEEALGERKIDVVIERPHDVRAIVEVARETGVSL
jgi:uncharacterized protein